MAADPLSAAELAQVQRWYSRYLASLRPARIDTAFLASPELRQVMRTGLSLKYGEPSPEAQVDRARRRHKRRHPNG